MLCIYSSVVLFWINTSLHKLKTSLPIEQLWYNQFLKIITGAMYHSLWEAGVKSFKHHLLKAIGNKLNHSRELWNSSTPNWRDRKFLAFISTFWWHKWVWSAYMPGHFLIGKPIKNIPEPNVMNISDNTHRHRLTHRQLITKYAQCIWKLSTSIICSNMVNGKLKTKTQS